MPSERRTLKIRIPQAVLDKTKEYSVVFRQTEERKSYFSTFKPFEMETFAFKPLEKQEDIHIYHIADVHYRFHTYRKQELSFLKDVALETESKIPFAISHICPVKTTYHPDSIKNGYKFEIVTDKPNEISSELIEKLGHGVTEIRVHGMYSDLDKYMLVCIIRKKQIGEMMKIIKRYPGTFASFTKVNEVFGRFKR